MGIYSFRKEERLNKEKHIQELFKRGSSFYLYPFKVQTLPGIDKDFHQILISVSVRNFKRAVDRNLIKRRIREAYRLNKGRISGEPKLMIAYIYTAKEIMTFEQIQEKLVNTFKRLNQHVEKK
jgi:ribonuclease P protein component